MSCHELSNADLPWYECIVLPGTLYPGTYSNTIRGSRALQVSSAPQPHHGSWRQGGHRR